jgi:enediyne biosynthesis protein E4
MDFILPKSRFMTTLICAVFCGVASLMSGCVQGAAKGASGIQFVDVTRESGIEHVVKIEGPPNVALTILETMGNGCAFLDYDNDGNLDILLIDRPLILYKGDGTGRFRDVTKEMGLHKLSGHFMGCAVGDFDNDGWDDVYISGFRTGLLLRNEAGKTFRDVTKAAGLPLQRWSMACGFVDVDGDGLLDLFVSNYVDFGTDPKRYSQRCEPTACGPNLYDPEFPHLYRNLGGGKFSDMTKAAGITDTAGKGLAVGFADYDDDGDPDIMVANDEVACDLFQNDGKGRFLNVAKEAGTAFDVDGTPQGGMGVDWADYDGDGRLDAVVTNYTKEPRSLYRNEGDGLFKNLTRQAGIAAPTMPYLAFGGKWLDYDNDGWPDLIFANGDVDNRIAILLPETSFRQPMQVFRNQGGKPGGRIAFEDQSRLLGDALMKPIVGRGLATGDFNNDGRVDVLVMDDDGPVRLLQNQGGTAGNWIGFSLTGTGKSNRNAHGARVTIETADGRSQVREVQTASSYLSASDRRLLFGIGKESAVTRMTVRWPDGTVERRDHLAAGKYHTIRQGQLPP